MSKTLGGFANVLLVDAAGNPIVFADGDTIPAGTDAVLMAGRLGATAKHLLVGASGELRINPTGTTIQPVSAPALEAQLGTVEDVLDTIDAVLDAIKDTDGIQDLKKWLGSAAPTVGQKAMVASVPVAIASDQSALTVTTTAPAATGALSTQLKDSGGSGSPNMIVDGSVTPVKFEFNADATDDIRISSLRLVFSASSFVFDGSSFGKGGGPLATGVTIDIVANNGGFTSQLAIVVVNEDFLRLLDFDISQAGTTDVLASALQFGGDVELKAGTADEISVTINDNLTLGARGIDYFQTNLAGVIL